MQAFDEYRNKDASFWALIKFVSEGLGYTDRRRGTVKSFSPNEVVSFCSTQGISINEQTAYLAAQYSIKRASLLNDIAHADGCRNSGGGISKVVPISQEIWIYLQVAS